MMRDRRLFDGERALKIADADLAAATDENVEDSEPHRMGEEREIGAYAFQGLQIDLWSRPDRAPRAACPIWRIDDEPRAPLCHAKESSHTYR